MSDASAAAARGRLREASASAALLPPPILFSFTTPPTSAYVMCVRYARGFFADTYSGSEQMRRCDDEAGSTDVDGESASASAALTAAANVAAVSDAAA